MAEQSINIFLASY